MRIILAGLGVLALLALTSSTPVHSADDSSTFLNGKDFDGWEGLIKEYWSFKDGDLVGSSEPSGLKFNTFLCSKKKYKDFELAFKVRLKGGNGNSGVQVRSEIFNQEKFAVKGPQCDVGGGFWGSLYGEQFGGMMQAAPKEVVAKVKKDDFNDYYIKVVGKHVTIKVNGETTVDADFPKTPDEGIIAWQLHAGGPMEVTFRNIKFKELK